MLSQQQRLAIFLYIQGYSNTELSAMLSVHPSTVRRWMRDSEFAKELKEEVDHAQARSRSQLQAGARRCADNVCAAARALQSLLLSDKTDNATLIQAAKVMVQAARTLAPHIYEPAAIPQLESDDPSQDQPGDEDPAPLLCDTLREDELTNVAVMKRMLAKTESDDPQLPPPDDATSTATKESANGEAAEPLKKHEQKRA
jgi:hypothetical protein